MKLIENATIQQFIDLSGRQVVQDVHYQKCTFVNCSVSLVSQPNAASLIQNVIITNCSAIQCDVGPTIVEDVIVDGLAIDDLLILWSPFLKHVVLRGSIGAIKINTSAHYLNKSAKFQEPFDLARIQYYAGVDWALDIREARFVEFEVSGIPTDLIRRDPSTQVVITREKALRTGWRDRLSPSNTHWPFVIDEFLEDSEDSIVLVAPKGKSKKKFDSLVAGLHELRDVGVAEPN